MFPYLRAVRILQKVQETCSICKLADFADVTLAAEDDKVNCKTPDSPSPPSPAEFFQDQTRPDHTTQDYTTPHNATPHHTTPYHTTLHCTKHD